jgi:trk system potassium uptake protein TrkA
VALGEFGQGKVHLRQLPVAKVSSVVGKKLCELDLPGGALVAAIMRQDHIIIPSGETVIAPDDRIIIVARREVIAQVEKILAVKLEFF